MKYKFISLNLFLLCSIVAFSQSEPRWLDLDSRNMFYPHNEYYVGFAQGNIHSGETKENATQRIKKEAMADAASSVKVQVKNTTTSLQQSLQTMSSSRGMKEEITHLFASATQTLVDMELPGLKTEVYQNPTTREISAFANARKADVINYFDKQITVNLVKLESALQTVEQLIELGQKIQARKTAENAVKFLTNIDAAQKMLMVVDPNVTSETLQVTASSALGRQLIEKLVALTQGVNVYFVANEINFGQQVSALSTKLQMLMSEDCSFVESSQSYDYKITITAKTRQGSGDEHIKFAFVDVTVSIFDFAKQKVVYNNTLQSKGGHTSWHLAGKEALESAAHKVYEQVKPFIR